jgi:UDP-glucuronate 4-epimerase
MRVLLTGAAGFIGSHLLERLLGRGDTVVGVDDFNDAYDPAIKARNVPPGAHVRRGDFAEVDSILEELRPDLVVHLAARAGVRPSIADPLLYDRVNVAGTIRLIDRMLAHGVGRLVFASSSAVYGDAPVPFREDQAPLCPRSPYGASKLAGEHYVRLSHRRGGLHATILRFFTVFGPRQRPDMAMHLFARRMRAGEPIPVYGDGDSRRDYTYIDDIIDGLIAAIDRDEPLAVYNLGGHQTTPLSRVIAILEQRLGVRARLERRPPHPADPAVTCADISRARQALGFAPKVGVEEGLARFVSWFNAGPDRP